MKKYKQIHEMMFEVLTSKLRAQHRHFNGHNLSYSLMTATNEDPLFTWPRRMIIQVANYTYYDGQIRIDR